MAGISLVVALLLSTCSSDQATTPEQHLIYLHGRIVELQGPEAVHPRYGAYRYSEIIDSLAASGAVVHHERRSADVDFLAFANKTSGLIDSLLSVGVPPANITVVGASKGGVLAMQIAHQNSAPIRYVLLGANTAALEQEQNWNLHGYILGIYEASDELAGRTYDYWKQRSTNAQGFEQLQIHTGLGHGFLYRPHLEWLEPVRRWMKMD